jgi:hypothetical protein
VNRIKQLIFVTEKTTHVFFKLGTGVLNNKIIR